MDQLELLYETEYKKFTFLERKKSIKSDKTLLLGPRCSGKTFLIYDYLTNFDKERFLYIDFNDIRVDKEAVAKDLSAFLKQRPIELLVLENFDFSFEFPKTKKIIISTCQKRSLKEFDNLLLYPLDFEEFISFDKKHFNIEQIFNSFANIGTIPQMLFVDEAKRARYLQEIIISLFIEKSEFEVFRQFAFTQSLKVSLFQVFNNLKQRIKISKDKFYNFTQKLEDEKLIFFVEKFGSKSTAKKVYLLDFAIKNALTFKKDFLKRFENIIFLELLKREKILYYSEGIDFYLPNENLAVLSMPFNPTHIIKQKVTSIKNSLYLLNIKKIQIITLGNEDSFTINDIRCEILLFWNWALQIS